MAKKEGEKKLKIGEKNGTVYKCLEYLGLSGTVMWGGSSPLLESTVNHLIEKKLPAVRADVSSLGKFSDESIFNDR